MIKTNRAVLCRTDSSSKLTTIPLNPRHRLPLPAVSLIASHYAKASEPDRAVVRHERSGREIRMVEAALRRHAWASPDARRKLRTQFRESRTRRLRGVLRESWRLGLVSHEDLQRAIDLAVLRGDRVRPRPEIKPVAIRKLLKKCARDRSLRGRRDLAMLFVLYVAGLRRAELSHLDLEHVRDGQLMVLGKGIHWRVGYLTSDARNALKKWIDLRGRKSGPLFVAIHRSGKLQEGSLSREAIARIVYRRGKEAGINGLRPHDLRRSRATHLLQRGIDLFLVQKTLGHKSILTTSRYDLRSEDALHEATRRFGS